jgi:plasmid stabilization system protein ParE
MESNNFIDIIDFNIDLIAQNPLLFPEINPQRQIHICVLNKHNSIVYKNNDSDIEIVRILIHKMKPIEF